MTTPEQQAMQLAAQAWREPAKSDLEMDVTRATVIAEKFATIIAEREALKAGQERDRMRLVACEMVALADTPTSAATAREMHPDYKSDACETVARRVDECIKLRAELQALRGSAEPRMLTIEGYTFAAPSPVQTETHTCGLADALWIRQQDVAAYLAAKDALMDRGIERAIKEQLK